MLYEYDSLIKELSGFRRSAVEGKSKLRHMRKILAMGAKMPGGRVCFRNLTDRMC